MTTTYTSIYVLPSEHTIMDDVYTCGRTYTNTYAQVRVHQRHWDSRQRHWDSRQRHWDSRQRHWDSRQPQNNRCQIGLLNKTWWTHACLNIHTHIRIQVYVPISVAELHANHREINVCSLPSTVTRRYQTVFGVDYYQPYCARLCYPVCIQASVLIYICFLFFGVGYSVQARLFIRVVFLRYWRKSALLRCPVCKHVDPFVFACVFLGCWLQSVLLSYPAYMHVCAFFNMCFFKCTHVCVETIPVYPKNIMKMLIREKFRFSTHVYI